mgnify:CR=1 FL=1
MKTSKAKPFLLKTLYSYLAITLDVKLIGVDFEFGRNLSRFGEGIKGKNGVSLFILLLKMVGQFGDEEKWVFEPQIWSKSEDLTIKESCP